VSIERRETLIGNIVLDCHLKSNLEFWAMICWRSNMDMCVSNILILQIQAHKDMALYLCVIVFCVAAHIFSWHMNVSLDCDS